MRRFAALLSALAQPGQDRAQLLAEYLPQHPDVMRLLTGPAPRRLITPATLRDWVVADTGLPDWLIDACTKATGDLAEALALLLPAANQPPEPDIAAVLADLASLPPGPLARSAILTMAHRLPAEPRTWYLRMIIGTFRPPVSAGLLAQAQDVRLGRHPQPVVASHEILAVMIYAEAALATGARGPQITLALWDNGNLVPVVRVGAALPAPQTAELMDWIRASATNRFGPLRVVPARQVFALGFTGLTPNRRRKSGFTLNDPQILGWHPGRDPTEAATLAALTSLVPNTA